MKRSCRHPKLVFGDSGCAIHCPACGTTWEARRRGLPDYEAGHVQITGNDVRVDPQDEVRG